MVLSCSSVEKKGEWEITIQSALKASKVFFSRVFQVSDQGLKLVLDNSQNASENKKL